ncbi:dentin sialophosphoprotein-like [Actinia tenebrosa]|uniref:Dentin sialophosphoprotein-like n=1 Tax=Actinia tenebrosa TaxID=6105 RepID=A0A6P8HZC1_ACTTE|nr:dentin sialophosphoprotein-like [Actinia tenebrosa]
MSDDDDNVESKSSSLGIISDFLSSFTSVGSSNSAAEDTESNEVEQTDVSQQETSTDTEKNTTDVESGGSNDGDLEERRQSSLEKITDFLSSFNSSGSSDDTESIEVEQTDSQEETSIDTKESEESTDDDGLVQSSLHKITGELLSNFTSDDPSSESKTADEDTSDSSVRESSDSGDQNTAIEADSGDTAGDTQSSFEKISDFLSSFTSLGSGTDSNNQTDEDNSAQQENENVANEDVIIEDDDSEETSFEGRSRSSSSRIFTEPETISKEDLDYVTLVSS